MATLHIRQQLLHAALLGALAVPAVAGAAPLTVMTYNTKHGGTSTSPATTAGQLDTIASYNPDVVLLQEAYSSQLSTYVNGLNARLGTTAWHGVYAKHCDKGTAPTCTTYTSEVVMVLTRLKTLASTTRLIWAGDDYHVARAVAMMTVETADGSSVNVFSAHLPAGSNGRTGRSTWVRDFQAWAQSFAGPKFVGGDFNDSPSAASIVAMKTQYTDAWAVGGTGSGYTHMHPPSLTPVTRIDYVFADSASRVPLDRVSVVGNPLDSDHFAVLATYSLPDNVPAIIETTLVHDRFDTLDRAVWPGSVITGTKDTTVPMLVENGGLRIGDLKSATTGSHYNGVSSISYNLALSGCASVQLSTPLNPATTAYAMFSVVRDTNNLYRWFQSGDTLSAEKKLGGVKTTLATFDFDSAAHQYLRIRKLDDLATGMQLVVFETAADNAGVPGTFTERFRDVWDSRVGAGDVKFELKAGTSAYELSPGSARWDNFHAGTNCR